MTLSYALFMKSIGVDLTSFPFALKSSTSMSQSVKSTCICLSTGCFFADDQFPAVTDCQDKTPTSEERVHVVDRLTRSRKKSEGKEALAAARSSEDDFAGTQMRNSGPRAEEAQLR